MWIGICIRSILHQLSVLDSSRIFQNEKQKSISIVSFFIISLRWTACLLGVKWGIKPHQEAGHSERAIHTCGLYFWSGSGITRVLHISYHEALFPYCSIHFDCMLLLSILSILLLSAYLCNLRCQKPPLITTVILKHHSFRYHCHKHSSSLPCFGQYRKNRSRSLILLFIRVWLLQQFISYSV